MYNQARRCVTSPSGKVVKNSNSICRNNKTHPEQSPGPPILCVCTFHRLWAQKEANMTSELNLGLGNSQTRKLEAVVLSFLRMLNRTNILWGPLSSPILNFKEILRNIDSTGIVCATPCLHSTCAASLRFPTWAPGGGRSSACTQTSRRGWEG